MYIHTYIEFGTFCIGQQSNSSIVLYPESQILGKKRRGGGTSESMTRKRAEIYLGVVAPLTASLAGGVDPLVLVGGAGARPRGGVELLVPDVVAGVAGVCFRWWFGLAAESRRDGRQ